MNVNEIIAHNMKINCKNRNCCTRRKPYLFYVFLRNENKTSWNFQINKNICVHVDRTYVCPLGTIHSTRVRAQMILNTGTVDTGTHRVEYYAHTHYCHPMCVHGSRRSVQARKRKQEDHETVYQWKFIVLTLKTQAEKQLSGAKATRDRERKSETRSERERPFPYESMCLWPDEWANDIWKRGENQSLTQYSSCKFITSIFDPKSELKFNSTFPYFKNLYCKKKKFILLKNCAKCHLFGAERLTANPGCVEPTSHQSSNVSLISFFAHFKS